MPITPHESIAGHRFSYNRHDRHCGGVVTQDLRDSPPQSRLARPWPAHAVPHSSPLFAQRTRSTWVSLRTARQVVKPNVEEPRPAHKDHRSGAGARDAGRPDPQLWCAHTHTSTRAQRCLRSAHTQLAQLPYPPAPPQPRLPFQRSFGQLKIVNRPTPQTSALFSGPPTQSHKKLSGSLGTS